MPTKLRIIYDRIGWAYYHRAMALRRHAPEGFEISLGCVSDLDCGLGSEPPDIIFNLCYGMVERTRRRLDELRWRSLLVSSFNTGWPRRREYIESCRRVSDATIINNRQTWEKAGRLSGTHHISNGVEMTLFRPLVPPDQRPPKVLWCGSIYHRRLKGYDDLLRPMATRLAEYGITSDLKLTDSASPTGLTDPEEMARWYNTGTLFVCTSEVEGTPNPALEAAASGCVVVSTAVGNMPELIVDGENGYLIERRLESLVAAVLRAQGQYLDMSAKMLTAIKSWDWRLRSREFFALFQNLVDGNPTVLQEATDERCRSGRRGLCRGLAGSCAED